MKTPEEIVKDYTSNLGGLSVIYEDKVVEMMYEYAQESSAQVRENLSYYIKLADDFQKERDMWRENFYKNSIIIDELEGTVKLQNDELGARADVISKLEVDLNDARSKLLANANGWQYAADCSNSWKEQYEKLKNEVENVSDFFAKYERRVI